MIISQKILTRASNTSPRERTKVSVDGTWDPAGAKHVKLSYQKEL